MEEKVYVAKDWSRNTYITRARSEAEAKGNFFDMHLSAEDIEIFGEADDILQDDAAVKI